MGRNGFLKEVTNFSLEEDHGDIAVLVVMSHGEAGGASGQGNIVTSNGGKIDIQLDIIKYTKKFFININIILRIFNNECEALRGKPKLIIIQVNVINDHQESVYIKLALRGSHISVSHKSN